MLDEDDILYVPQPKRLRSTTTENGRGLVIQYEDTEVTFEDPLLLPLARGLSERRSFRAADACHWGEHALSFSDAREVLEALVDVGILSLAVGGKVPRIQPPELPARTTTGAPGVEAVDPDPSCTFARSPDRVEELSRREFGTPFDLTLLECFVPAFRVAHAAFDDEGRQIGEASVRYDSLLQPQPTSWAVCAYAGARFHRGLMNVTALHHATRAWGETLAVVDTVRALYVERYGADPARFSLSDLYRCAAMIEALPAYALTRQESPWASGAIPAAVAHAFRIIDGVRFVSEAMLSGGAGLPAPRGPDDVISADVFVEFAETHDFLVGRHGAVCAGPSRLIHALADLMIRGEAPKMLRSRDREEDRRRLSAQIGDVESFLDYAEASLRAYLAGNLHQRAERARLQRCEHIERRSMRATVSAALDRYHVYFGADAAEPWARCLWRRLTPGGELSDEADSPELLPRDRDATRAQLEELLGPAAARHDALLDVMVESLLAERARLRTMESIQAAINEATGRPARSRSLGFADLPAMSEWGLPLALEVILEGLGGRFDRGAELMRFEGRAMTVRRVKRRAGAGCPRRHGVAPQATEAA